MAEWLYEAGIGEARAALVEDGRIVAAAIEPDDAGPLVGGVHRARLVELLPVRRGRVVLADGGEALLGALPAGITQGAALTVAITREAMAEGRRLKPAKAMPISSRYCRRTNVSPRYTAPTANGTSARARAAI